MSKKILFVSPHFPIWRGKIQSILKDNSAHQLSVGDIFRKEIKSLSKIGLSIKKEMDSGYIISAEKILELLKLKFFNLDQSMLLTDFPRTIQQTELLIDLVKSEELKAPILYFVEGTKQSTFDKLSSSFRCINFEHPIVQPSEKKTHCTVCGSLLTPYVNLDDAGVFKNIDDLLNSYYSPNGILNLCNRLIEQLDLCNTKLD